MTRGFIPPDRKCEKLCEKHRKCRTCWKIMCDKVNGKCRFEFFLIEGEEHLEETDLFDSLSNLSKDRMSKH